MGSLFDWSEKQINAAFSYIKTHWAEVEADYEIVLKEAEKLG
ncbi:hypothetical protein [Microcoleus sp. FACHB-68]|nr:hypothetical protein [Microcoleus sp. FACHB-68]